MNKRFCVSLPEAREKMGAKNIRDLINQAHHIANQFRQKETELVEILQKLDETKAYRATGYNSLFQFCIESLLLTEHQAYNYITVARKCVEIPELMVALEDKRITVSKARRINSVITTENKKEWISLAEQSSQRDLEKAVRAKDPRAAVRDHIQILSNTDVKLQATLNTSVGEKLQRVIELLREKSCTSISINDALDTMCDEYLKKYDPVLKAKRQVQKSSKARHHLARAQKSLEAKALQAPSAKQSLRAPVPIRTKHRVILRDQGQCRFHKNGKRCESRSFLQIHHRVPVSQGGGNELENLVLLCSGHHAMIHGRVN